MRWLNVRLSVLRWLGGSLLALCFVVGMASCGGGGECKNGIQIADYNTSGLQCKKPCDCSNLKYEGYCVSGTCVSTQRRAAQRKGEIQQCKLLQKVAACEWGQQEAQPEPLTELVWGDCIPPTPTPENTATACTDSQDNDCDGRTDLEDPDCAPFCVAGRTQNCYTGTLHTLGIGICRAGSRSCGADSTWGACTGEILPQKELCDGLDNNCNGQTDEECGCLKDEDCVDGWRCEAASCKEIVCPSAQLRCGRQCVDAQTNPKHCGRCDVACSGGNLCRGGQCRCSDGQIECNSVCVDTATNNLHCGRCANPCGERKQCSGGQCACKQGYAVCGNDCVDLLTDDKHCGRCGKTCPPYERCEGGVCKCRDASGICGGVCVDVAADPKHCGGCNRPCAPFSEQCSSGKCDCKPTHPRCDGSCVDTLSSAAHCGGCGKACAVGEICVSGGCTSLLSVVAGVSHTCAITACGQLKCWGDGDSAPLGYADKALYALPPSETLVIGQGAEKRAKQIWLGESHTCVLAFDQGLSCWGKNSYGQLGYGNLTDIEKPIFWGVDLGVGRLVVGAATGVTHTCAVLNDASLRCWGANAHGQLGYGDSASRLSPDAKAVDVGIGRSVKAVGAGDAFTCALLDNDTVKCWGKNDKGQLGLGDQVPRSAPHLQPVDVGAGRSVKSLSVGRADVCVFLDDRSVKCWGDNSRGQLGYGDTTDRNKPPAELVAFGAGRTAHALFSGLGSHRCALLDDGTARCWGANDAGQLGNGESGQDKDLPAPPSAPLDFGLARTAKTLSVGMTHTCAVLDNQRTVCFGDNTKGKLGYGDFAMRSKVTSESIALGQTTCSGTCVDTFSAAHCGGCNIACASGQICGLFRCTSPLMALKSGAYHNCSLQNGQVRCWGQNVYGQLGYGDTVSRPSPPTGVVDIGVGRTAKALDVGDYYTCAILDNDTLKCWGRNNVGQLGYSDTIDRNAPPANPIELGTGRTAKALALGGTHACAILDNDSIKCWGRNTYGQLGYNDVVNRTAPPTITVDLGSGRTAKTLVLGKSHSCAILDDASVKCWGSNTFGELGYGDTTMRRAPPITPLDLGAGRTAKALALEYSHTCVLLDNGTVKCWGNNTYGELGYGDTTQRIAPPATPVDLGAGRTATAVFVATNRSCALLDNGSLKCWGLNYYGQLGLGDTMSRTAPPTLPVAFGAGRTVKAVSLGESHTCAILDDHTVKCWGRNHDGQLGTGDSLDRMVPTTPVRFP